MSYDAASKEERPARDQSRLAFLHAVIVIGVLSLLEFVHLLADAP